MASAVSISDLTFTYAGREEPALRDIGVSVEAGASLLVLGPSGSGKSTLTLCLDGLIPHLVEGELRGKVCVAGLVTADHPVHVLATEVGLVFQDPDSQFCALTVEDEVAFGLENLGVEPVEIEERIDRVLGEAGLEGFRQRELSRLSGGEKQRVALAAVMAMGPRVLVLDEPSANLDPASAVEFFAHLRALARDRERIIVVIEHRLDGLAEWVDQVLVLGRQGRAIFHGPPVEAFYGMGDALRAEGVWQPRVAELTLALREKGWPVPGRPLSVAQAADALEKTPGLVSRLREAVRAPAVCPEDEILISIQDLTFRYPGRLDDSKPVLDGVSLDLHRGTLLAIAGANGAGKTTLAALLSGVLTPPKGTVLLGGMDVATMREDDLTGRVGYVFQNPEHQFVADTVHDELAFSLVQRKGRQSLAPAQEQTVKEWLGRFGLSMYAQRNPFSLSQGEKRRLSVAAMLVRGQEVIILDEPSFGQDEAQTQRLMATLQQVRGEGRTVVMVTHDMSLVAEFAGEVMVLAGGRVVFAGEPHELFSHPGILEEARLEPPVLGSLAAAVGASGLLTVDEFVAAAGPPPAGGGPAAALRASAGAARLEPCGTRGGSG